MRVVRLEAEDDFDEWRTAARALAAARIPADRVMWTVGPRSLALFEDDAPPLRGASPIAVPKAFVHLAERAVLHRDPRRHAMLYALLLRVVERPSIASDATDADVHAVRRLASAVRRDIHKMRAFVRFRELSEGGDRRFVAWFEPEHHVVRANARFFIGRFANMKWSILTPVGCIHWDGTTLSEGPPALRCDAPDADPLEEIWKTYYASIFNPARLMPEAMIKEMPKRYWKNMPETALVPQLIADARNRERRMIERSRGTPDDA